MFSEINIDNWERKEQYFFFKDYDIPFFNITAQVDITELYRFTRYNELSFFLTSLYFSTRAANEIEEFRIRIRNGKPGLYDQINAGSAILNQNNTFGFCHFKYDKDLKVFHQMAQQKLDLYKQNTKLISNPEEDDLIHYSVIPWIPFSSVSHARKFGKDVSIPKISFGKYHKGRKLKMPVSVEVNHALMDGYHVGQYFERFQYLINMPSKHQPVGWENE